MKESIMAASSLLPLRSACLNGLSVSAMGLGCMGMSDFYGESDEARSRDLLAYAVDQGIRFFDTADIYGFGRNERLVGSVLRNHPQRSEIVLSTKGGIVRDPNDPERRGINTSPAYLRAAVDRSLERLETRIDLYTLHRVEDGGARIEESMQTLAECLAAGKIGAVGLSEVSAAVIERANAALRRYTGGAHGIAAVQTEYSLMTRHIETDGIDETCRRLGILLVAYSPICRGLLGDAGFDPHSLAGNGVRRTLPRFTENHIETNRKLAAQLAAIAQAEDATPAQLALAWLLSRGPHVVPIPGTRSRERLLENIAAVRLEPTSETIRRLDDVFRPNAASGDRYTTDAMTAYGLKA